MNTILIITIAVATTVADVHELQGTYHYNKPITSYGVPSYTVLNKYNTGLSTSNSALSNGFGIGADGGTLGSGSSIQSLNFGSGQSNTDGGYTVGGSAGGVGSSYNTGYTVTGTNGQIFNAGSTSSNTGSLTGVNGGYQQSSGLGSLGYQYQTAGQTYQNNYHSSNNAGHYQTHYDFVQSGPPQIFKHFYVHTAPEEPEHPKPKQPIVLPPKQKHYNIIFVKTPTPPAGSSHVIPIQQETEEKTIVYVLVKNPEEIKDVVLPKFTPKQPSKPEVFFIKYDGKDDAHGVINNIVNDYQKHDSVSFNGIGVNHGELSSDNVVNQDSLSNKYGIPSDNRFVSSTEANIVTSLTGLGSSTPVYSVGNTLNGFSTSSGTDKYETGNEVTIGSSYTGSGKYVSSSNEKGQSNGNKFGGSNNYQSVYIETSNADGISNESNNIDANSIKPIEISSVGPTSTLNSIVTGNDIISTTSSPGNNFHSISSGLSVPFETYGPPQFKP